MFIEYQWWWHVFVISSLFATGSRRRWWQSADIFEHTTNDVSRSIYTRYWCVYVIDLPKIILAGQNTSKKFCLFIHHQQISADCIDNSNNGCTTKSDLFDWHIHAIPSLDYILSRIGLSQYLQNFSDQEVCIVYNCRYVQIIDRRRFVCTTWRSRSQYARCSYDWSA
jgi:hypothetical protein